MAMSWWTRGMASPGGPGGWLCPGGPGGWLCPGGPGGWLCPGGPGGWLCPGGPGGWLCPGGPGGWLCLHVALYLYYRFRVQRLLDRGNQESSGEEGVHLIY